MPGSRRNGRDQRPTAQGPVRQCAGCGRRVAQRELLRFVARDGALVAQPYGEGRGAYTCRDRACFQQAADRRAFARVLRRPVTVAPSLATDHYTGC